MTRRPEASGSRPAGDADVDSLYGVPLGEFTRARNALAAKLKKAGQADQAASVQRLQKPGAPVWAVNQAVRQDRQAAERFVHAVERLREAQAGRAGDLGAATDRQRAEQDRLLERARAALTSAGFSDSAEMLARVSKTLLGAAVTRPADLRAGRLTEELSLPGFEALAGGPPELAARPDEVVPPPRRHRGESAGDRQSREREERAREALRVAEAEAGEWAQRAASLDRAVRQHRATLAQAEAALEEQRRRLEEAERRVADARGEVGRAEREAGRARRESERAGARRQAARKALGPRH